MRRSVFLISLVVASVCGASAVGAASASVGSYTVNPPPTSSPSGTPDPTSDSARELPTQSSSSTLASDQSSTLASAMPPSQPSEAAASAPAVDTSGAATPTPEPSSIYPDQSFSNVRAAVQDEGSPADIASIQEALQNALDAQVNVGATDSSVAKQNEDAQLAFELSKAEVAERLDELDDNLVASLAKKDTAAINSALTENLSPEAPFNADFLNYTAAGFDAKKWDGIVVTGSQAVAAVEGHNHYNTISGIVRTDPVAQYQFELVRSGAGEHGWLITAQKAVGVGELG